MNLLVGLLGVGLTVALVVLQGAQINEAACDLAREVANEGDALVAGGVCQTPSYLSCKSEKDVKDIFKRQLDVFVKKNVDFLIAEVQPFPQRLFSGRVLVPVPLSAADSVAVL